LRKYAREIGFSKHVLGAQSRPKKNLKNTTFVVLPFFELWCSLMQIR
jgi:hypothetical protein